MKVSTTYLYVALVYVCDNLRKNQPSSHLQFCPVKGSQNLFTVLHTAQIFSNDTVMIYVFTTPANINPVGTFYQILCYIEMTNL